MGDRVTSGAGVACSPAARFAALAGFAAAFAGLADGLGAAFVPDFEAGFGAGLAAGFAEALAAGLAGFAARDGLAAGLDARDGFAGARFGALVAPALPRAAGLTADLARAADALAGLAGFFAADFLAGGRFAAAFTADRPVAGAVRAPLVDRLRAPPPAFAARETVEALGDRPVAPRERDDVAEDRLFVARATAPPAVIPCRPDRRNAAG